MAGGGVSFDGQTLAVKHVTADSTACLDVSYGNAANGQDVWTWDCNDTDAQQWTFEQRTSGDYAGSYRLVSKLAGENYCLDNRGDFDTSSRMGIWQCVADDHSAAANQSVTIAPAGDGANDYTLTFVNGANRSWLSTDRESDDVNGGANQTQAHNDPPASVIWQIGSSSPQQDPNLPIPIDIGGGGGGQPPYQPPVSNLLIQPAQPVQPQVLDPFDGKTVTIQHVTSDSAACLDVSYGEASDGQDVWTWACNETDAQKWTLEKRTSGDYSGSYRVVSQLGDYCLDNRGDFSTSDRMGIWSCVGDSHGAAANQSVSIEASGDGYTITFTNGSSSTWLVTDRASDNVYGEANQTTVSGTAPASAVWSIVSG